MNTGHITLKELKHAIHRLKNKKAPGPDGVPSELCKWPNADNRKILLKHLNEYWESESLEDTMNDASLATIYKKGRSDRPENYRPIALLNVTYKPLAIIIHDRLYETIDDRISKTQFGFRKNKGTAQPLFIYRRIQELQEESGLSFHTLLLDWEKAFDKVDQKRMIQAIRRLGIKVKIIRMIEAIYKEPRFSIKDGKTQTNKRRQMAGIRQGCTLSPCLFILLLITITHGVRTNISLQEQIDPAAGQLHNISLSELYYADDTLIMSSTAKAAETILQHIEQESEKYNMKLNYDKCIHLIMNGLHTITYRNGEEMHRKTEATYLGGNIFANGSYKKQIRHRITNTWITIRKLGLIWKKAFASHKWKLRVFGAVIMSKPLYGLEATPFTEQDCKQLDAFQYRGLRNIFGIKHSYWSGVKNKQIPLTANQKAKTEGKQQIIPISERQVKLHGHLVRADEGDLMKKTMYQDGTRRSFPDMPCMKRDYKDKKATAHWSAARNKERFSSRGSTAGFVPPSVYIGFRLFVLLGRRGDVSSMLWGVRGRLVSGANSSVGTQSCPTRPRHPALRSVPTRQWYVWVLG